MILSDALLRICLIQYIITNRFTEGTGKLSKKEVKFMRKIFYIQEKKLNSAILNGETIFYKVNYEKRTAYVKFTRNLITKTSLDKIQALLELQFKNNASYQKFILETI